MAHCKVVTKFYFVNWLHFCDKVITLSLKWLIAKSWQSFILFIDYIFCDKVITLTLKWLIAKSWQDFILFIDYIFLTKSELCHSNGSLQSHDKIFIYSSITFLRQSHNLVTQMAHCNVMKIFLFYELIAFLWQSHNFVTQKAHCIVVTKL